MIEIIIIVCLTFALVLYMFLIVRAWDKIEGQRQEIAKLKERNTKCQSPK
ncbi:MAG TPA: hypothetical protein VMW42_12935 [Desulfatiglandales bacterium]|nr:hypothetical protein [Desulfatiglandales bacterium]